MNQDTKSIIDAVINNNLHRARQAAQAALHNDKTKKDEWYCQDRLAKLEQSSALEPPYEVRGIVEVESCVDSFHADRYLLTEREAGCAEHVEQHYRAAAQLADRGIRYCNSTLLYGTSGTGKTTFARYMAYRLGLPLVYLNMSKVLDSYLGGSQKNITQVFSYVSSLPCVFLVDEIDAIGMRRGAGNDHAEVSRITISLMQALDTLPNHVVLIATTNREDKLDEALMRRFSFKHEVTCFTPEERRAYIQRFLDAIGFEPSSEQLDALFASAALQAKLESLMVSMLVEDIIDKGECDNDD